MSACELIDVDQRGADVREKEGLWWPRTMLGPVAAGRAFAARSFHQGGRFRGPLAKGLSPQRRSSGFVRRQSVLRKSVELDWSVDNRDSLSKRSLTSINGWSCAMKQT